jgi:hypothetical protein
MTKRGDAGPLPAHLVQERTERRLAQERLVECRGALEVLEREHADAEKALRRATEAVSLEGFRVLLREASQMADELMEAKQRSWKLAHRLSALDQTIGLTLLSDLAFQLRIGMRSEYQNVMAAIGATEPIHLTNTPNAPEAIARTAWKERHAALLVDAAAPVDFDE